MQKTVCNPQKERLETIDIAFIDENAMISLIQTKGGQN
jgi:hypothetical protein